MRFYLLDKVTHLDIGREARGTKCTTLTDEVLHDHFPDHPILPGALLTEGLAQLSGFLLEATFNQDPATEVRRAVLVQIEKMKFYQTIGPGEQIMLTTKIESLLDGAARVKVEARGHDEQVKAKGVLSFVMAPITSARVTEQRQSIYRVWTKDLKDCPPLR